VGRLRTSGREGIRGVAEMHDGSSLGLLVADQGHRKTEVADPRGRGGVERQHILVIDCGVESRTEVDRPHLHLAE
jgi:hypothetical protein